MKTIYLLPTGDRLTVEPKRDGTVTLGAELFDELLGLVGAIREP